jgi:hypothetical protein
MNRQIGIPLRLNSGRPTFDMRSNMLSTLYAMPYYVPAQSRAPSPAICLVAVI